MSFLVECIVKTSAIFAVALILASVLRRSSAALRHGLLAAAVFAAAATPFAALALPSLNVTTRNSSLNPPSDFFVRVQPDPLKQSSQLAASTPRGLGFRDFSAALWLAGTAGYFVMLAVGTVRLRRTAGPSSKPASRNWIEAAQTISNRYGIRRRVRLVESRSPSMLVTWGLFRPKILLPMDSGNWSEERIHVVLLHEFAHIRRMDWLVQTAMELLRAMFWFNPVLWVAGRQLRLESEFACDDAVLFAGVSGPRYAAHLLDVVQTLHQTGHAWSAALSMARPSTVERRFSAMLNSHIDRRPLRHTARAAITVVALAVALPLAALTVSSRIPAAAAATKRVTGPEAIAVKPAIVAPPAAMAGAQSVVPVSPQTGAPSGEIRGTVFDEAGKPARDIQILIHGKGSRFKTTTNEKGNYAYPGLPVGSYLMGVVYKGATGLWREMTLRNGRLIVSDFDVKEFVAMGSEQETLSMDPAEQPYGMLLSPTPAELVSFDLTDVNARDFFRVIADLSGMRIVVDKDIDFAISIKLDDIPWDAAMFIVSRNYGLVGQMQGNLWRIMTDATAAAERTSRP